MSGLSDLVVRDEVWDEVQRRFAMAIQTLTERAADATGDAHLDLRGRRKAWQDALALIETIRKEMKDAA
jgi:hypothetical protein